MTDQSNRHPAAPPEVPQLVDALGQISAAIDQARSLGLPVSIPEPLYRACMAIIERYDPPTDRDNREKSLTADNDGAGDRISAKSHGMTGNLDGSEQSMTVAHSGTGVRIQDVPLRRLIWQVIDPGEKFTVADVANRLSGLGASWPANQVSNALGYWVSRRRLTRERKGVYSYPLHAAPGIDTTQGVARQEGPAGYRDRALDTRGKESNDEQITPPPAQAAS